MSFIETKANIEDMDVFIQTDSSDETEVGMGIVKWGYGLLGGSFALVEENTVLIDSDAILVSYQNGYYHYISEGKEVLLYKEPTRQVA